MQWRIGASEVPELNRHRLGFIFLPLNYVALVPEFHLGLCDVRKYLPSSSWSAPLEEAARSAHISFLQLSLVEGRFEAFRLNQSFPSLCPRRVLGIEHRWLSLRVSGQLVQLCNRKFGFGRFESFGQEWLDLHWQLSRGNWLRRLTVSLASFFILIECNFWVKSSAD